MLKYADCETVLTPADMQSFCMVVTGKVHVIECGLLKKVEEDIAAKRQWRFKQAKKELFKVFEGDKEFVQKEIEQNPDFGKVTGN